MNQMEIDILEHAKKNTDKLKHCESIYELSHALHRLIIKDFLWNLGAPGFGGPFTLLEIKVMEADYYSVAKELWGFMHESIRV